MCCGDTVRYIRTIKSGISERQRCTTTPGIFPANNVDNQSPSYCFGYLNLTHAYASCQLASPRRELFWHLSCRVSSCRCRRDSRPGSGHRTSHPDIGGLTQQSGSWSKTTPPGFTGTCESASLFPGWHVRISETLYSEIERGQKETAFLH